MLKKLLLTGLVFLPMMANAEVINIPYTTLNYNFGNMILTDDKNTQNNLYIDKTEAGNNSDEIYQIVKDHKILSKPIRSKLRYSDTYPVLMINDHIYEYIDKNINNFDLMRKYLSVFKYDDVPFIILYKHNDIYIEKTPTCYQGNYILIDNYPTTNTLFQIPSNFYSKIKYHNIYKIGDYYIFNWSDIHDIIDRFLFVNKNLNDKAVAKNIDNFITKEIIN